MNPCTIGPLSTIPTTFSEDPLNSTTYWEKEGHFTIDGLSDLNINPGSSNRIAFVMLQEPPKLAMSRMKIRYNIFVPCSRNCTRSYPEFPYSLTWLRPFSSLQALTLYSCYQFLKSGHTAHYRWIPMPSPIKVEAAMYPALPNAREIPYSSLLCSGSWVLRSYGWIYTRVHENITKVLSSKLFPTLTRGQIALTRPYTHINDIWAFFT